MFFYLIMVEKLCPALYTWDYSTPRENKLSTPRGGVWFWSAKYAGGQSDVKEAILVPEETLRGVHEVKENMGGGRMSEELGRSFWGVDAATVAR